MTVKGVSKRIPVRGGRGKPSPDSSKSCRFWVNLDASVGVPNIPDDQLRDRDIRLSPKKDSTPDLPKPLYLLGLPRLDDQSGVSRQRVYLLPDNTVMKIGVYVLDTEAMVMQLVGQTTSIPVPRVLESFTATDGKEGMIHMEYIEGQQLNQVWDDLKEEQKIDIVSTVKGFVDELRNLRANYIGALDKDGVTDALFSESGSWPCRGMEPFLAMLASVVEQEEGEDAVAAGAAVRDLPKNEEMFPITHGCLNARNILVKDGKITGVVGWLMAGYYPEWWEAVKTSFYASDQEFSQRLVEALDPCPKQMEALHQVRKVLQVYGD